MRFEAPLESIRNGPLLWTLPWHDFRPTAEVNSATAWRARDSNFDGVFDSRDVILVFAAGEYEDDIDANSVWMDGDWNGDEEFDTQDIVFAFSRGTYSEGMEGAVAVPEASKFILLLYGMAGIRWQRTR